MGVQFSSSSPKFSPVPKSLCQNPSSPKLIRPESPPQCQSSRESWGENSVCDCVCPKRKRTALKYGAKFKKKKKKPLVCTLCPQPSAQLNDEIKGPVASNTNSQPPSELNEDDITDAESSVQSPSGSLSSNSRGNFPCMAKMNNKPHKCRVTIEECMDDLERFQEFTFKQKFPVLERLMDENYRRVWMLLKDERKERWLRYMCSHGEEE